MLLMIYIPHYVKDPKLWELFMLHALFWVMQDLRHQPYQRDRGDASARRSAGRNPPSCPGRSSTHGGWMAILTATLGALKV